MCGRYYIDTNLDSEALSKILADVGRNYGNSAAHARMKTGEIFPTNTVPIVSYEGVRLMKWGYSGYKNRVINARSETAFEKPMFRKSLLHRRCLVPASGYYEWQRTGSGAKSKQKYAFYSPGDLLYMAGLWREEQGEDLPVFVILTREASASIASIHDRMPLILASDACSEWIRPDADAGSVMCRAVTALTYSPAPAQ